MNKPKTLGTVFDVAEIFDRLEKDEAGRVVKRSTCYDLTRRLPDHLKIRIGRTLLVNLPKLQEWIESGGSMANGNGSEREAANGEPQAAYGEQEAA